MVILVLRTAGVCGRRTFVARRFPDLVSGSGGIAAGGACTGAASLASECCLRRIASFSGRFSCGTATFAFIEIDLPHDKEPCGKSDNQCQYRQPEARRGKEVLQSS